MEKAVCFATSDARRLQRSKEEFSFVSIQENSNDLQ